MSEARPAEAATLDGKGIRLALVTAQFNAEITSVMRARARDAAQRLGVRVVHDVEVPGTFDMGPIAKALLLRPDVDALVALGAVVQGETGHDRLVAENAARKLADLAVETGKPVGMGITGPGQTQAQARARVDRAGWAVESIVKQFRTLASLRRRDARVG